MSSEAALSSTPDSVSLSETAQSIRFLDLPLEIRIMIYMEITKRPENHYETNQDHPREVLSAIFCTHPQITREIYQSCTLTAHFGHHGGHYKYNIFEFLATRHLKQVAKTLINFNAQTDHKGAVLNIELRCWDRHCSREERCRECQNCAEYNFIRPIEAMGLERRLITLI